MPQTQTAWNVIYTALKRALPAGIVHAGDAFERFEQDGERIVAHFASGHAETADLLIGADGGRSAVRAQLMPDVRPTYAGYVAWRGRRRAGAAEQVLDLLRERFTFQQGDAHLFLAYLVPGADGAIEAGKRRVNWVWYRRLASDRLRSLFVARDGTQRDGSLPPGAMRDDNRAEFRRRRWPDARADARRARRRDTRIRAGDPGSRGRTDGGGTCGAAGRRRVPRSPAHGGRCRESGGRRGRPRASAA